MRETLDKIVANETEPRTSARRPPLLARSSLYENHTSRLSPRVLRGKVGLMLIVPRQSSWRQQVPSALSHFVLVSLITHCSPRGELPQSDTTEAPVGTTQFADSTTSSSTGNSTDILSDSSLPTGQMSGDSPGSDSQTSCAFCIPDLPNKSECDIWTQDCQAGFKCAPFGFPGSGFEQTRCVPVADQPKGLFEPCSTQEQIFSGLDDCAKGMFCSDTDPATLTGVCYPHCTGTAKEPQCPSPLACVTPFGDAFNLCTLGCNPLPNGCGISDQNCYPVGSIGEGFDCFPDNSGPDQGKAFDACISHTDCDAKLACMLAQGADECIGKQNCCLPFCDTNTNDCPGNAQQCLPWYIEGTVPPSAPSVGICGKNG